MLGAQGQYVFVHGCIPTYHSAVLKGDGAIGLVGFELGDGRKGIAIIKNIRSC